jgi:recombination protein RecA
VVNRTRTAVIFINQLREKIGVMFGNPEVTPGGRALKYYASVRLDIRRIDNIKEGTEVVGNRTRVRVVKNKVAPPFKSAEFDIMYGKGISKEGSIIDVGAELEILVKSGSWYSYKDERIGQGRENTKVFLMQNPDILDKIENEIKEKLNFKRSTTASSSEKHEPKPGMDKESIQKEINNKRDGSKKVTSKKVNITEPKGDFNLE